jgi:two-component system, sensor histidine kinase PdtaS
MSEADREALDALLAADLAIGLCLLDGQDRPLRHNAVARRLLGDESAAPAGGRRLPLPGGGSWLLLSDELERRRGSDDAHFRSTFQASPEGMALVEAGGRIALVNPSLCALFGYRAAELVGSEVTRLVPQALRGRHGQDVDSFFAAPQERRMAPKRGVQGLRADGSLVDLEIGLNPIPGSDPPQVLVTVSDITERLRTQRMMEQSLREKTVLLNEVHHRVKNNLQVIASLLRLQSRHADSHARLALQDSMSRVRAMALTHQLLYESNDFSELELGNLLRRLGSLLRDSYLSERADVRLQISAPARIAIGLQQAVPCGLLVNELVTNAFKHAFPEGRSGCVTISAELLDGRRARVRVADDGVGLPEACQLGQSQSLGFQLIPSLVEQLSAQIEVRRDGGSCFTVEFLTEGESA